MPESASRRDRRTRRREGRRLGRRDSGHQARPVEVVRPPEDAETQAAAVGRGWVQALAAGDLDDLMAWYDSDAVVHHEGEVLLNLDAIRRCWAASNLLGRKPTTEQPVASGAATGGEFDVVVRWDGVGTDGADLESRLRIEGSSIIEQWHGEVRRFEAVVGPPLEVSTSGRFTSSERQRFVDMMWQVLDRVETDVRHAGLRLEHHADPARPAHFSARAHVQLDRQRLHARASASTLGALLDLLEHRLRLQLVERADRRDALRHRGTSSPEGQWRHGDRPSSRSRVPARDEHERVVIVRTTWAGGAESVDEAVEDLEALDLEVLLFEEITTRQPAVVWLDEADHRHVRLASGAHGEVLNAESFAVEVAIEPQPFPVMDLESARTAMSMGEPWVAFRDELTGRAAVLYRRVDGHDGLVMLGSDAPR